MTLRLLIATAGLSLVLAAPASAFEPDPGDWTSSPVRGKGARAEVSFSVDGQVAPAVDVSLRRCGRRAWSRSVEFAAVPVAGGGFSARVRSRAGGARLAFKLEGTFDSSFDAHGTVRGTVKLRRGGKKVTCRLPKLSWTAELAVPSEDEEAWPEDETGDEEYAPDEYDPEVDEEYGPDDEDEYGEDDEEYPEDEYPDDV
jgi:hypothetical protein